MSVRRGDAGDWSDAMDAELLLRRRDKKLAWKSVAPIGGMNAKRCQNRYTWLMSDIEKPEVRKATVHEIDPTDRDGLQWLYDKRRITPRQMKVGLYCRTLFHDAGDLSLKSCLGDSVGGSTPGPALHAEMGVVSITAARRAIFVLRYQVLRGQDDLLTVVDGVCGMRHTLRALAGGDGHRARELELALKIALDMVSDWLVENAASEVDKRARTTASNQHR